MQPITLEAITAKQTELNEMIQRLQAQAVSATMIEIEGTTLTLQPGEHYAGAVLDENGNHKHHLVLMAQRPVGKLAWQFAMDWATRVDGALPTRQEQALLFANCKPHLEPVWHWSSETHDEDASSAWGCHFYVGDQYDNHKSYGGSAVAVRRV